MDISRDLSKNKEVFDRILNVNANFDVVYRTLWFGGREACIYFIDGFTKDETLLRILQNFSSIKPEDMPENAHEFSKRYVPTARWGWRGRRTRSSASCWPACPACSSTATTAASPSTAAPTPPEAWRSRTRTRCCAVPGTASWRR